ncbi:MAG: YwiC-like family protein [Acidimicrobiaceae bacterium]|nr:YwiC-like family protein [Acidimicrobiaceae bacterium]
MKVVLVDARRRRVLPGHVAQRVLAAEAMLLSLLVAAALVLEASAFWMPLVGIVPLVLVELWFDMRSRGRRLVPELVGAIGMGGVVAVIVLAGDGSGRRRQRLRAG